MFNLGIGCAMISDKMKFLPYSRFFDALSSSPSSVPEFSQDVLPFPEQQDSALLRTIGWLSAGVGAITLGLLVGLELRQRYKFNRRTPYDLYSHSGDEREADFGLGI